MSNEQLFTVVLALVGALYAGLIWEVRKLRQAKHRDAQHIQWCCLAVSLCLKKLDLDLDPPKVDE